MFQLPLLLLALSCCSPGKAWVLDHEFTNNDCLQFFFNAKEPTGNVPNRAVRICQTYKNLPRFATLYDKSNRIPLYSAYIYEPGKKEAVTTKARIDWMVEPQLVDLTYPKSMEDERDFLYDHKDEIQRVKASQAINEDYDVPMGTKDPYDRGHLNTKAHHKDADDADSTMTLTNITPQKQKLNQGAWREYEEKTIKNLARDCDKAYAIVGVIPGRNFLSQGRVNIPASFWAAGCCKVKNLRMKAWAVVAENSATAKVQPITVGQLEKILSNKLRSNVKLFDDQCPRN